MQSFASSAMLAACLLLAPAHSLNPFSLPQNEGKDVIDRREEGKPGGGFSVRIGKKADHLSNEAMQKTLNRRYKLGASVLGSDYVKPTSLYTEVKMHNYHDFQYTAPLYIGQHKQSMELVYDTGSDWLTIEGDTCADCGGNRYQHADSNTFAYVEDDEGVFDLEYGSALLTGQKATDRVCMKGDD